MRAGSAGELGHEHGLEQVGFWRKILEHPSYDAFWQEQAMDKILAARPLKVPTMLVHSLWDQEDIYGAVEVLLIPQADRKSTRLNSSHVAISYAVFCLKKKYMLPDPEHMG